MLEKSPSQTSVPLQYSDDTSLFCRRCGVIHETRIAPGKGPHHAAIACAACGAFIRWLARPRPPTTKQIKYLCDLGYRGPQPETIQAASEQIGAILTAKEARRG